MNENIFKQFKTKVIGELSIKQNIVLGEKLEKMRNLLVLKPKDLASVLTVSTNTIIKAEKGGNVGVNVLGELMFFYGYTIEEFSSLKNLPSWEELQERIISFHKRHNSKAYKILEKKPRLIDLIELRLLHTTVFKNWIDESGLNEYCRIKFNFDYIDTDSTLELLVKRKILVKKEDDSGIFYKKN